MAPHVGFIGVGRMGLPMCANLVRAGCEVSASDRCAERRDAVVASGASWRNASAEVAAAADVLITMLPGPAEVRETMLGDGAALRAMRPRTTWIDMSSSSPVAGREIAMRAEARSVDVLDAPVGGGVPAARAGTLRLFVGGHAEVIERHRPLLEALADPDRIVHVGAAGSGYTTKLLVNLLWFGQVVATTEALLIGRLAGIDVDVLRTALAGSAAASELIRHDLDALLAGDYLESFGLDRCCEELENAVALGRDLGAPVELSTLVERMHRRALARYGPVGGELLAAALLEEQAGVRLRHRPP